MLFNSYSVILLYEYLKFYFSETRTHPSLLSTEEYVKYGIGKICLTILFMPEY